MVDGWLVFFDLCKFVRCYGVEGWILLRVVIVVC